MTLPTTAAQHIEKLQHYLEENEYLTDFTLGSFDANTKEAYQVFCRDNGHDQDRATLKTPDAAFPDWVNEILEDYVYIPTGFAIAFDEESYVEGADVPVTVSVTGAPVGWTYIFAIWADELVGQAVDDSERAGTVTEADFEISTDLDGFAPGTYVGGIVFSSGENSSDQVASDPIEVTAAP